ncbi:ribosomal L1p/L10e family protein, partial [Chlamydia psittaci 02DC14]
MAKKLSKNVVVAKKLVSTSDVLPLNEAIELAKKASYAKFNESVDIALNLNLDTRKAEQQLRGAIVLPNG